MTKHTKIARVGRNVGKAAVAAMGAGNVADKLAAAITGTRKATKSEAATLAGKRAKGGKPGQARANQSAQYSADQPKPNADTIASVKNDASGGWGIATTATGQTAKWRRSMETAELGRTAVVGGSLKAVQAIVGGLVPPRAALAKGAEREVHSKAAAMASAKANNKAGHSPAKVAAKERTLAKKAEAKEKKAVNKPGTDRAYKVIAKAHGRKDGTWTAYMLTTIMAHGSTAAATAAHKANKAGQPVSKALDFKWAADVAKVIAFK